MPPPRISRVCAFSLLLCGVWLKSAAEERGAVEVLIKVQIFDNSDLSPLKEAAVQVHGNQSVLASGRTGEDGIVTVNFLYRPGTWVIVSASKHGFVTNSAPWHANRIPLYASVSLYLLPQRPATMLLYDDVVQLLLGSPGSRSHPWVQLQRKNIEPTFNASQVTLSAMLTSTRSQYELGGFPYPIGLENSTGLNSSWVELTALAAACAMLTGPNGTEVQVSEPIHVSVPLPSDSPLKSATSVPVWRFEDRTDTQQAVYWTEGIHLLQLLEVEEIRSSLQCFFTEELLHNMVQRESVKGRGSFATLDASTEDKGCTVSAGCWETDII